MCVRSGGADRRRLIGRFVQVPDMWRPVNLPELVASGLPGLVDLDHGGDRPGCSPGPVFRLSRGRIFGRVSVVVIFPAWA